MKLVLLSTNTLLFHAAHFVGQLIFRSNHFDFVVVYIIRW